MWPQIANCNIRYIQPKLGLSGTSFGIFAVDNQCWQQLLDYLNYTSQGSTDERCSAVEKALKFAGLIAQDDLGLMREAIEDEFGIGSSRHSDE